MDQVKIYLALLVKYHFWVLSVLALIIGLTGWVLATGTLAAIYQSQRQKIDGKFATLKTIEGIPNHPNKSFEEGVDKLLNDRDSGLKSHVLAAWSQVYDQQKNVVLKWPEQLGEDFQLAVQDKGPNDEVDIQFRERYQNYVKAEFPRLIKMAQARSYLDAKKPLNPDDPGPIVLWKAENQRAIDDSLDWPRVPTTKEMFYVQEDLWVYHALLKIIANMNATAHGNYNARIKEIMQLEIARYAGKQFQSGMAGGRLFVPQATPTPGTAPQAPAAREAGGPAVGGGGANAALAAVQEEGRYVDAKGMPLAAGAPAPPEFKRMPVYLQLLMDQREISNLLAECANSPLPIEVRIVRINPAHLRGKGRGTVSPSVFAGNKGGAVGDGNIAERNLNPYDLPIEIYGVIYIYNRPDRAKLNVIGQAPETPVAAPAVEGAPSADPAAPAKPAESPVPAPPDAAGTPAPGIVPPSAAPVEAGGAAPAAAVPGPPAAPAAPPAAVPPAAAPLPAAPPGGAPPQ